MWIGRVGAAEVAQVNQHLLGPVEEDPRQRAGPWISWVGPLVLEQDVGERRQQLSLRVSVECAIGDVCVEHGHQETSPSSSRSSDLYVS
jgi:hypothetical protein